jgi:hypothetical protein
VTYPIPNSLDALLTRDQTAEALTNAGFPTKAKTLATKASRGGGPPFRKWSGRPLYRWGDSLAWAESLLSPLCHSTSSKGYPGMSGGSLQRFGIADPYPPAQRMRDRIDVTQAGADVRDAQADPGAASSNPRDRGSPIMRAPPDSSARPAARKTPAPGLARDSSQRARKTNR